MTHRSASKNYVRLAIVVWDSLNHDDEETQEAEEPNLIQDLHTHDVATHFYDDPVEISSESESSAGSFIEPFCDSQPERSQEPSSGSAVNSKNSELEVGIGDNIDNVYGEPEESHRGLDDALFISSDHDILHDSQPVTIRNILQDLTSEWESDSDEPSSTPSAYPSSTPYAPTDASAATRRPQDRHDGGDTPNDTLTLSLKLDTLKRQVRRHIPLLRLMRKAQAVVIEKMPSPAERKKGHRKQMIERTSWQYWYNPMDLVRTILSATSLRKQMYFGMAQYADEGTELWHSKAWGSSIRTTSGDVCYTRHGELIILGDIIRLRGVPYEYGRVTFIGRDRQSNALVYDEILVTLQAVVDAYHPWVQQHHSHLHQQTSDQRELLLMDSLDFELGVEYMEQQAGIYLDRDYDNDDDDDDQDSNLPVAGWCLQRVLTFTGIRPLRYIHQTRGELEVEPFGRGKIANVFTSTLGPHGADKYDVVEATRRPIQNLDACLPMEMNGTQEGVCAFVLAFLGDMPEQAENAGLLQHQANMGCRTCLSQSRKG
ncbi:MAG: hypothetical protein Q9180_000933 [Flavoplaca navasiana]